MDVLLRIRNTFMAVLAALVMFFAPAAESTETAELAGTDTFVMESAIIMGQGITTDGEYYYTSGTVTGVNFTALSKMDIDTLKVVEKNITPLPSVCKERGNNHIGGISYYNGKIYAPVEGGDEVPACIVVFDAETLEAENVYDLPASDYPDGVPWCAVDSETGYLYASVWAQTKKIHVYDVNDGMKYVKTVEISEPVKRIEKIGTMERPPTTGSGTFISPTKGTLSSRYGVRWERNHNGIDVCGAHNTDILAADGGEVTYAGWMSGYGNYVVINHENGYQTAYAHCESLCVSVGDRVCKGELIAKMGSTGRSTGTHLHFEVKKDGQFVNPLDYVEY